jgi:hypothetical protein
MLTDIHQRKWLETSRLVKDRTSMPGGNRGALCSAEARVLLLSPTFLGTSLPCDIRAINSSCMNLECVRTIMLLVVIVL